AVCGTRRVVPVVSEFVTGGPSFVDEASRRGVVTALRCQGAEVRDETGRGGIVRVRWCPGRTPRRVGEPPPNRVVGVVDLTGEAAEHLDAQTRSVPERPPDHRRSWRWSFR